MDMTVFHALGYWLLALLCVGFLLVATWLTLGVAAQIVWDRMARVYDIFVLNWWIRQIKRSGRTLPTRGNVEALYEDLKKAGELK